VANFDLRGAILATSGMLLLVFALVEAPGHGWGSARTVGELAGAFVLLAAFLVNEQFNSNPLVPLSIFRIKGLAAADSTQLIAIAGFYSMFFFVTLYMQNVLGYSQIKAGLAYVPLCAGVGIAAGICSKVLTRTGSRAVIVAGLVVAAGGLYWLSRIPVHGSYLSDLFPGLMIMSGRRVRGGDCGRQRRSAERQGRPGGGAPQHFPASRRRARLGHLLRRRHLPHQPPPERPRNPRQRPHVRVRASPAVRQHLLVGRRRHRSADLQHQR
jgi:hypothetical protein